MKISKLKNLLALAAITLVTTAALFPLGASAEWKQDSNGWWNTEGNSYSIGWKSINGAWYYFDSTGYMKTGWTKDGTSWYYMDPSGAMKTGWVLDNGSWYYLNESGSMKSGLVDINGKTYYLNESGVMQTGNITINGVNYTFAANGEKITSNSTVIADTTKTPQTTSSSTESTSSGGSGGSGGSSSSTGSTSSNVQATTYKDLYGTWTIKNRIPSTMTPEYNDTLLSAAKGQSVVVDSNKVSSLVSTISNPDVTEGTMSASDFSSKYNDTLKNLGISGDTVKYVTVTQPDKSSNTATILIADNGKTYAIAKGAVFAIEKK